MVSKRISDALALAGRHVGPYTAGILLELQAVKKSLLTNLGQPGALTGPSILPNVTQLELMLYTHEGHVPIAGMRQFVRLLLQRLPNLISARLSLYYPTGEVSYVQPLLHLKHLELGLDNPASLDAVPFAAVFPALETAHISALHPGTISELDVSGCCHLGRLVLEGVMVHCLSKPTQCKIRLKLLGWRGDGVDASQLQSSLAEISEVLLESGELYPASGLFTRVRWPKLEAIMCNWLDYDIYDPSNEYNDNHLVPDSLVHLMRQSSNLPALKSIVCGDSGILGKPPVMKVCIPADLAGVEELMFAIERPLRLVFGDACSAGQKLNTFCVVASEVRVDAGSLLDMIDALFSRGLTLSRAQAGQEHKDGPSQCLYLRPRSAQQLSYEEAVRAVNARVEKWGRNHDVCPQCGACFDCLGLANII